MNLNPRWLRQNWLAAFLALLAGMAIRPPSSDAASLTICSASNLVEAINSAQAANEVITFECDGTNNLAGPIVITGHVALDATGRHVVLNGNGAQIFTINPGASISLTNITLSGGRGDNGGAIFNRGSLILSGCLLTNNVATGASGNDGRDGQDNDQNGGDGHSGGNGRRTAGGAIYNLGSLLIVESEFRGNSALGGSGGFGGIGGSAELVAGDGGNGGNGGAASGGAIFNAGQLQAFDSTFEQNRAQGGDAGTGGEAGEGAFAGELGDGGRGGVATGGAIFSTNKSSVVLERCTLAFNAVYSGHSADGGSSRNVGRAGESGPNAFGGGLSSHGTSAVVNCTFYGNTIEAGNGGSGGGGEMRGGKGGNGGFAWGGNMYNAGMAGVVNCTMADGVARPGTNGFGGDGFFEGKNGSRGRTRGANVGNGKGRFTLKNTILSSLSNITNSLVVTNFSWTTNIISDVTDRTNALRTICTRDLFIQEGGTVLRDSFDCISTEITSTNTIVAGTTVTGTTNVETAKVVEDRSNGYGAFKDFGYNLISDKSIKVKKNSTSRSGISPEIGTLGNNGGPTETIPLEGGSPAIDAADPEFCLETDQRGIDRPAGGPCDIGAYEFAAMPPSIETDLEDLEAYSGENVAFSVVADGAPQPAYQWYFNETNLLAGATNSTLQLTNVQVINAGTYHVVLTNSVGSVTSALATLTVTDSGPILTVAPVGTNVVLGGTLTLTGEATGSRPLGYQWYFSVGGNFGPLTNASSATLTITNFQAANEGFYTLEVTNRFDSIFSDAVEARRP